MVSFKKLRQMIEVQGNGNIVSREFSVSSFLRLHLGLNCNVELIQSDEEKVIVVTDENLQDFFEAVNSGRTLYVSAGHNKLKKPVYTSCKVQVHLRQMDTLYVRNEKGNVTCANEISLTSPLTVKIQSIGETELNVNVPSLKVLSQCIGDVRLKGRSATVEIKNQSQGNFDASGLVADTLTIKNMSQGNIDLYAEKEISISHMGIGYVHFRGNAVLKDVKQRGEGLIKHVND